MEEKLLRVLKHYNFVEKGELLVNERYRGVEVKWE